MHGNFSALLVPGWWVTPITNLSLLAQAREIWLKQKMPNGHRPRYRVTSGQSPSPAHTSDSEVTWSEKKLYYQRRAQQQHQCLLAYKVLPENLAGTAAVVYCIAQFLWLPWLLQAIRATLWEKVSVLHCTFPLIAVNPPSDKSNSMRANQDPITFAVNTIKTYTNQSYFVTFAVSTTKTFKNPSASS